MPCVRASVARPSSSADQPALARVKGVGLVFGLVFGFGFGFGFG